MTVEQFEDRLRQLLRQKPFLPFVVEFVDGRTLIVDSPKVVFNGGAATYISEEFDFVEFFCADVAAFRPFVPGPTV